MSEEELQLLITLDDPVDAPEEDIFNHFKDKLTFGQCATLVRASCPVRPNVAHGSPISSTTYARMFPELPSFEADEQFLHALGRSGGACDRGDIDDSPDP